MIMLALSDTVIVAIVVAFSSVIAPVWLAHATGKQRRKEKAEDYAREDAVAARLLKAQSETADAIVVANEATTRATREVGKAAAERTQVINGKLDVIHTLVNSQMTAALQAEFDAINLHLIALKEISSLKEEAGRTPSKEASALIKATQIKLDELREVLATRREQDAVAQAQIEQSKTFEVTIHNPDV